jgi:polar amino acid transport system substrate-binding protein
VVSSRRLRSAALVVMLALCAGCVGEPDRLTDRSIPDFDEASVMGAIQEEGRLVVAIDPDAPPISSVEGNSGKPEGLGIELAELVAESLGVRPLYIRASSEEVAGIVAAGGADMAFPPTPLTTPSLKEHPHTNPYYVGHQRLLVRKKSGLRSIEDLSGRHVCSYIEPATELLLDDLNPEIDVDPAADLDFCIEMMKLGRVDAVTSSDLILMRLATEFPAWRITGEQLTTEGYGAIVQPGASNFADFIDGVMREARIEGISERWYERWLDPLTKGPGPSPPELSAEEAAAFFPEESIATE